MSEEDFLKAKPKKEDIINLDEINIQDLRVRGIAETEADALGLLSKDIFTAKGNPINLAKLSQIFKKNLNEGFTYTLLILDENKRALRVMDKQRILRVGRLASLSPSGSNLSVLYRQR